MTRNTRLIPKYAIIPATVFFVVAPVYFVVKLVNGGMPHHNVALEIDDKIPFVHWFAWIYMFAYVQWFIGYLVLARNSEETCKRYMAAELIGKAICVAIFVIYPTSMIRPEILGDGFSERFLAWVYAVDSPDNLFPSLHCMESWIVARGILETKAPQSGKIAMWLYSLLVIASVLLVKQHLVLDILGGIVVAELAMYLSKKLNAGRIYDPIEKLIFRKN